MLYSVENRKRGTKSCNKLSLPWQQLWRMRKRARDNESPHRVQLSHLPSLPPTLHQFAYLLAGTHIREMQSSLPPAAAVHNEWSLSQCAAASSRCYTAPAIAFLYIGTLFRRFSMRAVKGPARPYSVNQEESAAPRHGAPLTQAWAPTADGGKSRTISTTCRFRMNGQKIRSLHWFLSETATLPHPFSPLTRLHLAVSPFLFLPLSLSFDHSVCIAGIFTIQETK